MRLFASNVLVIMSFLCFCPAIGNGQLNSSNVSVKKVDDGATCPPSGTTFSCPTGQLLICTSTNSDCKCSCEPVNVNKSSINIASIILSKALDENISADKLEKNPEIYGSILRDIANSDGKAVSVTIEGTVKEVSVKPSVNIEEKFNEKLLKAADKIQRID